MKPGKSEFSPLLSPMITDGVETILGVQDDPVFGPVVMFGLGGIFVEVLKDVVFHRCPFGEDVAEAMIRSIHGAPLLFGARGRKPADTKSWRHSGVSGGGGEADSHHTHDARLKGGK